MNWNSTYQILFRYRWLLQYMADGLFQSHLKNWQTRKDDPQLITYAQRRLAYIAFKKLGKLREPLTNTEHISYFFRFHTPGYDPNELSAALPDNVTIRDFWKELEAHHKRMKLDSIIRKRVMIQPLNNKEAFDVFIVPDYVTQSSMWEDREDIDFNFDV